MRPEYDPRTVRCLDLRTVFEESKQQEETAGAETDQLVRIVEYLETSLTEFERRLELDHQKAVNMGRAWQEDGTWHYECHDELFHDITGEDFASVITDRIGELRGRVSYLLLVSGRELVATTSNDEVAPNIAQTETSRGFKYGELRSWIETKCANDSRIQQGRTVSGVKIDEWTREMKGEGFAITSRTPNAIRAILSSLGYSQERTK